MPRSQIPEISSLTSWQIFFLTCVQFKTYQKRHIHVLFFFLSPTLHIPGLCVTQMQFHHDRDGCSSCYCCVNTHEQLFCWVWPESRKTRCRKWTRMLALAFNSHNPLFRRQRMEQAVRTNERTFVTMWPTYGFCCVFYFKFSHAKPWGGRSNGNKVRGDFRWCSVHVKSIWFTHANKTRSERR